MLSLLAALAAAVSQSPDQLCSPAFQAKADAAAREKVIWAAADEFDGAQFDGNRAVMDRYLAADFVFVRGRGSVSGREDFIAGFTSQTTKFEPFEIAKRFYIDLGPGAAIVGGEGTIRGTEAGEPFAEHFQFADTYSCRDGKWKVVYVQVTPIKPAE